MSAPTPSSATPGIAIVYRFHHRGCTRHARNWKMGIRPCTLMCTPLQPRCILCDKILLFLRDALTKNSHPQIYTMHSPFPSRNYSCGKGVRAIVDQGCDQIFKRKPIGMVDDLWEIVHICWARDPTMRPSMRQVDSKIRALSQTI